MASEAAFLGTPSIFISSLAGTMGNFIELEESYDLLYSYTDDNAAQGKAMEILQNPHCKEISKTKRERLLKDKIDVTAFIIQFIESYPFKPGRCGETPIIQRFINRRGYNGG